MALVGVTSQKYHVQALRLTNTSHDIVPKKTWDALNSNSDDIDRSGELLCLWNNWGPVEELAGRRFRWVNNDAELLLFNASKETRYLNLELERGPALKSDEAKLLVSLNDVALDTVSLNGLHRLKIALPNSRQKENLIKLHLDKTGRPTFDDARILDFRVFRAFLSKK
jgi:hypothetical protein